MFSKHNNEFTKIGIDAVDYVDFSKIDNRIKHSGGWMESYPMQTSITVPTKDAKEIIEKLKKDNGITSVDGEMTAKGIEVNEEMSKSFGF
jgi:hypothetical protein